MHFLKKIHNFAVEFSIIIKYDNEKKKISSCSGVS